MKRYRKRFNLLSAACAVMLMVAVLTACSGGNGQTNGDPGTSKETDTKETGNNSGTNEATEQQSNQSDKSMQGEVNVISGWGGGITDKFNKMMVEFNKVYPNIKVNYMEQGTGELAALISAGNTPDIIIADGGRFPRDWVKDNLIEDLTPYIESDPDVNPDMFYEPAYKRGTDPDGKVWQLPFLVDPNFPILYNREVLEQYGNTEIPEMHSLQELGDFLKSYWIVENGEQVMTTFSPFEVYGNFNSLLTFAYLNGADSSSFYNQAANTVTFNDPKIVEALEWMIQFKRENIDDERMNKLNASLPENTARFAAGKSLLQPNVIVHVQENLQLNPDLQLTPMPAESLWIGGHGLSLTTLGKKENKDAAWTLLKWISSSKDGAEANLKIFGNISGIKDNPYFLEQTATDPVMKIAYDVLQQAAKLPPFIPVQYEGEFDQKFGEVAAGTLEPKAFLDHMTKFTQALLDELKK
ncbi:extracellular solute-binding protein [Paenibacillus spongiae]|uniref:Extracellular solute-binding protein n=1 Tax=Paenibacillus spongiae TaxID=2909671 RepID=A0ABY5S6M5_9BACL|nr:extracellular solute-binding protein [Paenibacillus spongiae]UVI28200.1 extracellular solute-binding protein [Paenibacillus spongiae]